MRFSLWVWPPVLLVMLTMSAFPEKTPNRVALVIGNANYADFSMPVPTTIGDAKTLAEELDRLDFNVSLKTNVGSREMQRSIDAFVDKLDTGMTALFYFAGFGLQIARQTYLIPVDVEIWSESDVRRNGISMEAVLTKMHRKRAKTKIVILDAARRNPFERRFRAVAVGLAALNAPEGTLAIFAVRPGAVVRDRIGANSLFMSELIKELRVPDRTAEEAFSAARVGVSRASNNEQVPWVTSSLLEAFSFEQPGPVLMEPIPSPSPTPAQQTHSAPSSSPDPTAPASIETARIIPRPGGIFRDCPNCVELVVVAAGSFQMGTQLEHERPPHHVTIAKPFAVGRYEVSFDEWDMCVNAGSCKYHGDDRGWGRGNRPVINVSWLDAKEFATWLSRKTGQTYRLPSEAEWEYFARGATAGTFWWDGDLSTGRANCNGCNPAAPKQTMPVGSYEPNPFGLYDTAGNAAEWVEDCWNDTYRGAPGDGSVWLSGECRLRVLRGGSFNSTSSYLRSASRFRYDADVRYFTNGFRLVRELR